MSANKTTNTDQEKNMTSITAHDIDDPAAYRLAKANDAIAFWKTSMTTNPEVTDQTLDRLQPHLRERDHLLSLTDDERSRAAQLWQYMHSDEFTLDEYDAVMREYSMILEGAE